jgi:sugar phosphate isomerase/epimerase
MFLDEFSIQLYTLRDVISGNFAEGLKKVAECGFTGVEFAGYDGVGAKEMRGYLDSFGLKSVGSHVSYEAVVGSVDEIIEYNSIIGSQWIVCPYGDIKSADDALRAADAFAKPVEKIVEAGMRFAYHNHHMEFAASGEHPLDVFFRAASPSIYAELDVFWAAFAKVDPIEYMKKLGSRIKLLHVKQIDGDMKSVDMGEGAIDFKELIDVGKQIGVEHYILEQEDFEIDPWTSARNGARYILGA